MLVLHNKHSSVELKRQMLVQEALLYTGEANTLRQVELELIDVHSHRCMVRFCLTLLLFSSLQFGEASRALCY